MSFVRLQGAVNPDGSGVAPHSVATSTPGTRPAWIAAPGTSTAARVRRASRDRGQAESHEPADGEPQVTEKVVQSAPPWLISMVVHMGLLIVLALIWFKPISKEAMTLNFSLNPEGPETLDATFLGAETLEPDPDFAIDAIPVDDPLAAPPTVELETFDVVGSPASPEVIPNPGLALTGRVKGNKKALLAGYGGTEITEAAVKNGLEWLKRQQRRDGSWSLVGPYLDGGGSENKIAATAMAVLAFQGAGHTHQDGEYKSVVDRAWDFLLKQQDEDGSFFQAGAGPEHHRLYSQAQVTIAICELFAMTRDSQIREHAERAIQYAVKTQAAEGGWRYTPGSESDTSVTGWFVMALQSAQMAGLQVPSPTLTKISDYLDLASTDGGSQYAYQPGRGASVVMTAEALLCRQYLGWKRQDPRLVAGVKIVSESPIDWDKQNVYYWYYATQVMHHMEGEYWEAWNKVMRESLPTRQVADGKERGSWDPKQDQWGQFGGRLYETCLCVYMLEVYYRHLPIYKYRLE